MEGCWWRCFLGTGPDRVLECGSSGRRGRLGAERGSVISRVLTNQVLCVALDLFFRKNEAIIFDRAQRHQTPVRLFRKEVDGIPGKSFALMAYEELGHFVEMAALQAAALVLDVAELLDSFLELPGEARAVEPERGQLRDQGLGAGGLGEQFGFEEWDAVEAPGGVGEFLDELGFGGSGRLVFVEELAAVELVGGQIFGRQDRGSGSETVSCGVERRTLFAGGAAWAGGILGVVAIYGGASG